MSVKYIRHTLQTWARQGRVTHTVPVFSAGTLPRSEDIHDTLGGGLVIDALGSSVSRFFGDVRSMFFGDAGESVQHALERCRAIVSLTVMFDTLELTQTDPVCLHVGLVYVLRLQARGAISFPLKKISVYVLYLACVCIASKLYQDTVYDNASFARAGYMAVAEFNGVERAVLRALDYRVAVSENELRVAGFTGDANATELCAAGFTGDANVKEVSAAVNVYSAM